MRVLLGLDYDGTLVEIRSRPEEARLSPRRRKTLKALLARDGIVPVFISGRKIAELLRLLRLPPCWAVGDHGAVIREPDGTEHVPASSRGLRELGEMRKALDEICALDEGLWIEEKRASVAMHYRGASPRAARAAVERAKRIYLGKFRRNLDMLPMKKVVEFCLRGVSKGRALAQVHRMLGGKMPVVYFGDDATDVSAIEYAEKHGRGVYIGTRNITAATWKMRDPEAVHRLLKSLLSAEP